VTFAKQPGFSGSFGLDVKVGPSSVRTRIRMHANCSVSVDRSHSGDTLGGNPNFMYGKTAPTEFDCVGESLLKFEVLLDNLSVEAFLFDWYSLTNLVFTDANGIELWTDVGDATKYSIQSLKLEFLEKTML
jgi:sucrose-6-phosphate hydrolase SacC (GH32 family)